MLRRMVFTVMEDKGGGATLASALLVGRAGKINKQGNRYGLDVG